MAKIERIYNVPLRKGFLKAPRYRKSKKAVTTLREFIMHHMKCSEDQVKIGKVVNEKIWERGIKNPPHHVKVTVVKEDDGIVKVELFGFKFQEPVKAESKEEKKESGPKPKDKIVDADLEKPKKSKTEKTIDEEDETGDKPKPKKAKAEPVEKEVEPAPAETVKPAKVKTETKDEKTESKPKRTTKSSEKPKKVKV
ncbi:MAG: 50S ribosomal protein L31e [archaeon]